MNEPVRPAMQGTHWLSRPLGMQYTIGRDHVSKVLERIIATGTAAVDIETFGLGNDARKLKCVTFADTGEAVILDPRDPYQHVLISTAFAKLDVLIFHKSSFDLQNLFLNSLLQLEDCNKVVDTLIYARLAESLPFVGKKLTDLAERYLGMEPETVSKNQIFREMGYTVREGWKIWDLNRPAFVFGAAADAIVTARVVEPVRLAAVERLTKNHPYTRTGLDLGQAIELVEREQIVNRMFLRRSGMGIRINPEFKDEYEALTWETRTSAANVLEQAGVGPNKATQLVEKLEEIGALPEDHPRTPKTGKPSTIAMHLEHLDHPLAKAFVELKQIDKVQHDYLAKCVEEAIDGRIHPEVNILGASATGRMSYSNPCFQQFPENARGIVLADQGDSLTSIDWRQIQPVLAAYLARDSHAIELWEAGEGDEGKEKADFYIPIAQRAGISRKQAKIALLALLFGKGLKSLARDLGTDTDSAAEIRDAVFAVMPGVQKLMAYVIAQGKQHKKIPTVSGRILTIGERWNEERGYQEVLAYKAVNYYIQGSEYDLLAETLLEIEHQGLGNHVFLAMHDEIVCSTSIADDVQKIMETPPARLIEMAGRIPVLRTDRKDLGERWAAA
jgi:DNA polymerase I